MNWPGTVESRSVSHGKNQIAQKYGKPIDGYAPGLQESLTKNIIEAGQVPTTSAFTDEESAWGQSKLGMKVAISRGSSCQKLWSANRPDRLKISEIDSILLGW